MKNQSPNYPSYISTYLSISGAAIILINFALGNASGVQSFFKNHPILSWFAAIALLTCVIWVPLIVTAIDIYILNKRKFSQTIIEKQDLTLDIYEDGKKTYFSQKVVFCRIGRRRKDNFEGNIRAGSGTITPMSALNCSYSLNLDKKLLEFEYTDHPIASRKSLFLKRHHKFLMFTSIFHDTFTSKEEFWELIPKHYCKNYTLEVILPKGQKLKSASIVKIVDNTNSVEIPHLQPMLSQSNGREKIIMQIIEYDQADKLKLTWEIN